MNNFEQMGLTKENEELIEVSEENGKTDSPSFNLVLSAGQPWRN